MSGEGCWRCGSPLHHRRDCQAQVAEGSAALIKKQSAQDQKFGRGKTSLENKKWAAKQQVLQEPILPRQLLRKHLDIATQLLYDLSEALHDVGPPCFNAYKDQINSMAAIKIKFHGELENMRDVVASSKHYLNSLEQLDTEDIIFKHTLWYVDVSRHPLWIECIKRIATLQEMERLEASAKPKLCTLREKLLDCQRLIEPGERSPTGEELEELATKLRDAKPELEDVSTGVKAMKRLSDAHEIEAQLADLRSSFDKLWNQRGELVEQRLEKVYCPICMTNEKEVALLCGHQCCRQCLHKLQQSSTPHCPFCKNTLAHGRRLYNN